jgi:hypothetical protein
LFAEWPQRQNAVLSTRLTVRPVPEMNSTEKIASAGAHRRAAALELGAKDVLATAKDCGRPRAAG